MSRLAVLDASALLCLLNGEAGAEQVGAVMTRAVIGAVNYAEVISKLRERGLPLADVETAVGGLNLDIRALTPAQAIAIGDLRPRTRDKGLSLGDRACLALAIDLDADVLTTDRIWDGLDLGPNVQVAR